MFPCSLSKNWISKTDGNRIPMKTKMETILIIEMTIHMFIVLCRLYCISRSFCCMYAMKANSFGNELHDGLQEICICVVVIVVVVLHNLTIAS